MVADILTKTLHGSTFKFLASSILGEWLSRNSYHWESALRCEQFSRFLCIVRAV
jgi:hypothetical protein